VLFTEATLPALYLRIAAFNAFKVFPLFRTTTYYCQVEQGQILHAMHHPGGALHEESGLEPTRQKNISNSHRKLLGGGSNVLAWLRSIAVLAVCIAVEKRALLISNQVLKKTTFQPRRVREIG